MRGKKAVKEHLELPDEIIGNRIRVREGFFPSYQVVYGFRLGLNWVLNQKTPLLNPFNQVKNDVRVRQDTDNNKNNAKMLQEGD